MACCQPEDVAKVEAATRSEFMFEKQDADIDQILLLESNLLNAT
jgi:hypothetical protein